MRDWKAKNWNSNALVSLAYLPSLPVRYSNPTAKKETLASPHYKLAFHGRFLQLARPCAYLPSVREFSRRFTTMQQSTGSGSYPADWPYINPADWPYITAAFRCSSGNQAYMFIDHEYLLLKYDETTLDGGVLDGPKLIEEGMPSLANTIFGDDGITGAFGLHGRNEAFIFTGNWCARIRYARDRSDFKILEGPLPIFRMFPCLDGTVFENYVGAAFESTTKNEAYLFHDNEYAVLNYKYRRLISYNQTFDCLKDTVFERGIYAAFASHVAGEAFIFKNDSYALINFVDQRIVGDVKKIRDCPTLGSVLPRGNMCQMTPDYFWYDGSEYSCEEDIED